MAVPRSRSRRHTTLTILPLLALGLAFTAGCSRSSRPGGTSAIVLNELMAANSFQGFAVTDGAGNVVYLDWVELYNAGSSAVSLAGYSLTDNRGTPDKFRFPPGAVIGAQGYVLVFLLNPGRCRENCEEDRQQCRADAGGDPTDLSGCEQDNAQCLSRCATPAGYVANFNFSASGETLYLFGGNGAFIVDQVGVREQPPMQSNGLDPETGEYGVIYVPTPRARNKPVNIKPQSFKKFPSPDSRRCDVEVRVTFEIKRDVAAPGELEVTFEYADVKGCAFGEASVQQAPVVRFTPAGGDEVRLDETRVDVSGAPLPAEVIVLSYMVFLPPAACGVERVYRVTARDAVASPSVASCIRYGQELPTVLVNEYQPRNSEGGGFLFRQVDADGEVHENADPDWIEVWNYGSEPVDVRDVGLISGRDFAEGTFDTWTFGKHGGVTAPLPAGGFILVLADNDENALGGRRTYYRRDGEDPNRPYFSTQFALDPNETGPPDRPFDSFVLVDSVARIPLDTVVLDFSQTGFDIKPDQSVGRFPDAEGTTPGALMPGTITDCPTPELENRTTCDVVPTWQDGVSIATPTSVRCPAAGEDVKVVARINFDADTADGARSVKLELRLDESGPWITILQGPDLTVVEADNQSRALPGATLYEATATIPGQPVGTLVEFQWTASDRVLGTALLNEATSPGDSFRYLVGFVRPADAPRINEVLPHADGAPDFAEIHNPSSQPLDLSGFYLTDAGSPLEPIELARRFRIPDGTMVPPDGFLALFFGPVDPPGIVVTGFNLDDCAETLHLIAPDERDRGANCLMDTLSWDLEPTQEGGGNCPTDRSVGRICEACEGSNCAGELEPPTPGASNRAAGVGETLFHDVFHQAVVPPGIPTGERNACVPGGASVELNAVLLVDDKLRDAFGESGRVAVARLLVDRGAGEEDLEVTRIFPFRRCTAARPTDCVSPPSGYSGVLLQVTLDPPMPAVVRYRLRVTDACGNTTESGAFSFGTAAGAHAQVAINEVNRSFPIEAGGPPRPWIEIFNRSPVEVDLSGASISNETSNPRKATLPAGSRIPAGGTLLVVTDGVDASPHVSLGLSWSTRLSGALTLFDSLERGSCLLDAFPFDFTGLADGMSLGRLPDGAGNPANLGSPSPGAVNSQEITFLRGDATEDSRVNISDMIRLLAILFSGDGRLPRCQDALDSDDNGELNATDAVFIGDFVFRQGPPIPAPFPQPGTDPTPDGLEPCSS